MKKLLIVLAILALCIPAMADINPWAPVDVPVSITVEPIAEIFWQNADAVALTVEDFGDNNEATNTKTKSLWCLGNIDMQVSCAIAAGDLNPYTVLKVSVPSKGTALNFRRDSGNTYVQENTNVLFSQTARPVGASTNDPQFLIPINFFAYAWNGVADDLTANLTLRMTVAAQ